VPVSSRKRYQAEAVPLLLTPARRTRRRLAPRSARLVARVLDLLFILALGLIPISVAIIAFPKSLELAMGGGVAIAIPYLLFADVLGKGAGPGKRLAGIRVVDTQTGKTCSFAKTLVRSVLVLLGPLDWSWILGRRRRRLGDLVAGTDVIADE
jgi:uncharacterized RDD family membrane protein YckC